MRSFTFLRAVGAVVASIIVTSHAVAAVTIETVPVGNPGNAADTRYHSPGFGAVSYGYAIGKYEITAGQYTEFLNAVAKQDTYGVYNGEMATSSGITQSGPVSNFNYTVAAGWQNRPMATMNALSAMRFVNWLSNGQPIGPQDLTTEDGTYFLDGTPSGTNAPRKPNATWVLASVDEWYKAAYFEPGTDSYWTWPTHPTVAPVPEAPPGGSNSANTENAVGATVDIGSYLNSPGPNGTFDMGGNVQEFLQVVTTESPGVGGWYDGDITALRASSFDSFDASPNQWFTRSSFRVALIPEPSGAAAVGASAVAFVARRRRRAG